MLPKEPKYGFTVIESEKKDAPPADKPEPASEEPKKGNGSSDDASHGFIMAAATNLWLAGSKSQDAVEPGKKSADPQAFPPKATVAEIKRSLWSSRKKEVTDKHSRHKAKKEPSSGKAEIQGEDVITHRLEEFGREFKTMGAKLSRAEAELEKQTVKYEVLQKQKEAKERDLQSQVDQLKGDVEKMSSGLKESRQQLEDEKARQAAAVEAAVRKEEELAGRIRQFEQEAAANAGALSRISGELKKRTESLQALQKQSADREKELQSQVEQLKNEAAKVSPGLEQAQKQLEEEKAHKAAAMEAAAKKENELTGRIQQFEQEAGARAGVLDKLKEELKKRTDSLQVLQKQNADREKDLLDQIEQLKGKAEKASPGLVQVQKQLEQEKARQAAAVEAAAKKEEEFTRLINQINQEAGARAGVLDKLKEELKKRTESLQAVQKQSADREKELQDQIEQIKGEAVTASPGLDQAQKQIEEEKARQVELQERIADLEKQVQVATDEREMAIQQLVQERKNHEAIQQQAQRKIEESIQPPQGRPGEQAQGGTENVTPVNTQEKSGDYTAYWKLKCLPFESAPDSTFFFESMGHREGIARLLFSIQNRKALAVLSGDYGSGKSVLCQEVIERLAPNQFKTALVANPRLDALDLVREMARQFGEEIQATSRYDIGRAFSSLLDRSRAAGQHCAAIIDEAQVIERSAMEDLRLLLNHQAAGVVPMTLVFVGQTELNDMLRSIPHLYQRINMKFHIPHLAAGEVREYIRHRLKVAGGTIDIFDERAVIEVQRLSQRNPREINAICDVALLIASLSGKTRVSVEDVTESGKERT